jgi:peptidoglycan/xylan/chitin deacetylase (PgdA/CDA1 family)
MPDSEFRPSRNILHRRAKARREVLVRRRRTVAGVILAAALIALIAATANGGSDHESNRAVPGLTGLAVHATLFHFRGARGSGSPEDKAISRVLGYTPFVSRGSRRHREIALTFDDGPGPYTLRVVHTLRHLHAQATFFQVGQMIPVFRQAGREVARFFPIGDHTLSHPLLGRLPRGQQRLEVIDGADRLRLDGIDRLPRLFRPPYASFDADTFASLRPLHMLMVLWSIDSEDYLRPGAKVIVHNVLTHAFPGAIVLMHDAGGERSQTIAALPAIVHKLRKRHYRFVTVPRLLLDAPPPKNQKPPPNAGRG